MAISEWEVPVGGLAGHVRCSESIHIRFLFGLVMLYLWSFLTRFGLYKLAGDRLSTI